MNPCSFHSVFNIAILLFFFFYFFFSKRNDEDDMALISAKLLFVFLARMVIHL